MREYTHYSKLNTVPIPRKEMEEEAKEIRKVEFIQRREKLLKHDRAYFATKSQNWHEKKISEEFLTESKEMISEMKKGKGNFDWEEGIEQKSKIGIEKERNNGIKNKI